MHYAVWYNRKINVSKENIIRQNVLLHFEGSDYLTKVWINGKYIGINEGGYSRFSFNIENYIKEGENDITVKVEDSLSKEQPRGKQRYKKESWKCWYIQTTGIWKTVWLEYVPINYLKSVKNTPDLDTETIRLEYETNILEKEFENNNFYIETEISFNEKILNNLESINSKHKLFAEGYKYEAQPIIMSEYGGIALNSEEGWGYGKQVKDENEFLERFNILTDIIKKIPYIKGGYCYTQLTDVQQEINGLVDENRNEKFSNKVKEKIKEINSN